MKIVLEIPDDTRGAFFTYVHGGHANLKMSVHAMDEDNFKETVIVCKPDKDGKKGGQTFDKRRNE